MEHRQLCVDCETYPSLNGSDLCMQCKYGPSKSADGEKPVTKTEKAHTALSQLVANGHCSGAEALGAWYAYQNRPKKPFFARRKQELETEEEKRARLEAIARETRKMYPENFGGTNA